jgi:hypothetical protein
MIIEGAAVSGNVVTVTVEPVIRQDVALESPIAVAFESVYCDALIAGAVSESGDMTSTVFSFTAYAKLK